MIVVFKDRAKDDAKPTRTYGKAIGSLILKKLLSLLLESKRIAISRPSGNEFIPPTKASYKIGNDKRVAMATGAYSLPKSNIKRKTKAAVGALFKTMKNGLKTICNFLKVPTRNERTKAMTKPIPKPIKVLNNDMPIDFQIYEEPNKMPNALNDSIGLGKTKFPLPVIAEMIQHKIKTKKIP